MAPSARITGCAGVVLTTALHEYSSPAMPTDAQFFLAGEVVEVWDPERAVCRGTAAIAALDAGSITLDAPIPGVVAGDVLVPAPYELATPERRALSAYLAGPDGTLPDGSPAYTFNV